MGKTNTLIIGLGKSSLATADFLTRQRQPFSIWDTRLQPPNLDLFRQRYPDIELRCGDLEKSGLDPFSEIIVSPGISTKMPILLEQKEQGKTIIGDIELFLRYAKGDICAITGSNAKSTVTTLVAQMAKTAGLEVGLGGNIGIPVLGLLTDLEQTKPIDLYVLELSSFQLETTYSLRAKAATVLNVSPDHLDRYSSLTEYIEAKQRIYHACQYAIYNHNDTATYPQYQSQKKISFALSVDKANDGFSLIKEKNEYWLAWQQEKLLSVKKMYLSAPHHWENALAALALGTVCGLPMETMLTTLKTFKGLPHRCQLVKQLNGVDWYNDSKGTNEGAAKAAIESLGRFVKGKIILLAGGVSKGAKFNLLKIPVNQYVAHAILFGEAKEQLAELLTNSTQVHLVQTLTEAVQLAKKLSRPKDAVLLSPACASFDMFNNFEHRGYAFEEAVQELPE